jgi:CHAT domain-containing protein
LEVAQDEVLGLAKRNESSRRKRTIDSLQAFDSTLAPEQISQQTGAVILEYWLKPGQSYLWAVTPKNVALFKLPTDTEINAAVQDYRKALLDPRDPLETGNASGRKLYDMLVAPAHKLIRPGARVVIIADGALNNLNFETLIAPAPKPHYWIEDVILSDASSLALLAGSRRPVQPGQKRLLLVGDPLSASPEYPRLPQAATEIDRVEQHFPGRARLVLAGAQATPQAYLASDTSRFSYVHFVAHGTASRTTPLESAVILSPQGDSYKLYARDIVTKPLRADLVTISTCYGAGSRAYTGEGLVGLSWAFLRAGAHNTIAALWEVNDASTAQLMDQLYAGIDKGLDPAVALRAAKLAMAHSDGVYRRPFYWAPFQLYQGSSGAAPKIMPRTPSAGD